MDPGHLTYFISKAVDQDRLQFQFDPETSDLEANSLVLNNLIGTLVKTGASGRSVPYLAEQYWGEDGGRTWTYKIRNNLTCDDGSPITAELFALRLKASLKKYSETTTPIDFSMLRGWADFAKGRADLDGVSFDQDHLYLKFDTPPEMINEFLKMPYFGYWCEANFKADGSLVPAENFVSSGAYSLSSIHPEGDVSLTIRPDWFSVRPDSPHKVRFQYANQESVLNFSQARPDSPFIVHSKTTVKWEALTGAVQIEGIPGWLASLIINPRPGTILESERNRRALRLALQREIERSPPFANHPFYVTGQQGHSLDLDEEIPHELKGKVLTLGFRGEPVGIYGEMLSVLKNAVENVGARIEVLNLDPNDPNVYQNIKEGQLYDLRLTAVSLGGHFINAVVKMIFCTTMGATYPDPSGRICRLVKKQEGLGGAVTPDYIQEFNESLLADSCVVPMRHYGNRWLLSPHVSAENILPVSDIPNLEDIQWR